VLDQTWKAEQYKTDINDTCVNSTYAIHSTQNTKTYNVSAYVASSNPILQPERYRPNHVLTIS